MISFVIVFSFDVFHEIANLRDWIGDLYSTMSLANFSSLLLSQRIFTIDLVTRHIIVTAQWYNRPLGSSVDGDDLRHVSTIEPPPLLPLCVNFRISFHHLGVCYFGQLLLRPMSLRPGLSTKMLIVT